MLFFIKNVIFCASDLLFFATNGFAIIKKNGKTTPPSEIPAIFLCYSRRKKYILDTVVSDYDFQTYINGRGDPIGNCLARDEFYFVPRCPDKKIKASTKISINLQYILFGGAFFFFY